MRSINISATVGRAQAGNASAITNLYNSHADSLWRYCYLHLGDGTAAEDCVQEVFVRLWKDMRTFEYRDDASFTGWLYSIAKRVLIAYIGKEKRLDQVWLAAELLVPRFVDGVPLASDQLALRDAIRLLPDNQRQLIMLKFFVRLSTLEIAGVLGCTEGAVKALQRRALAQLQRLLAHDHVARLGR